MIRRAATSECTCISLLFIFSTFLLIISFYQLMISTTGALEIQRTTFDSLRKNRIFLWFLMKNEVRGFDISFPVRIRPLRFPFYSEFYLKVSFELLRRLLYNLWVNWRVVANASRSRQESVTFPKSLYLNSFLPILVSFNPPYPPEEYWWNFNAKSTERLKVTEVDCLLNGNRYFISHFWLTKERK